LAAIELTIFDCDGVLVDSEPLANRAFAEALQAHGFAMSYEDCLEHLVGLSLPACAALLERRFGRPLPDGFLTALQARTYARFHAELRPVDGIVAALDRIERAGFATCVASSGEPAKLRVSLGATGLWARFEGRIFSAVEVARGKPFPDLFLHAAARMGVAAARTAVVEDSVPGVRAAVAAGMRVFGYVGGTPRRDLAAEGAVEFAAMSELPALLGT